jgi:hypothetical protein
MSGPVHMNQVIFQTPNVEKVQQVEHQLPDQAQRQASQEEQKQFQVRTETVQTTEESENSRVVKNDKKEREKSGKRDQKKARGEADKKEETGETPEQVLETQAGRIVDVII